MATRLVVLDPDASVVELFRGVGEASGYEVSTALQVDEGCGAGGDLAAVAPAAFETAGARRAFLEASEPDSVLLLIDREGELDALADEERQRLAGFAVKPLGPKLAAAHLEVVRRRREDRLRREATLRAIPDMIFRMDRGGRYLDCHPRDHDDLLSPADDFIGRRARDVLPAAIAEKTEQAIEEAFESGSPQSFRYELARPGGDTGHYEARLAVSGPDELVAIVRDVTDVTRAEIELKRGAKMRQALASRILYLQETERHHLARELHDAIGQMLLVHKLDAEFLRTRATSVELQKAAGTLARGLEETLELVRSLARGLRPSALDDLGLEPALEMLAEDFARHAKCRVIPDLRLSGAGVQPQVAITLFRIAQEALANAVKHGRCRTIWMTLDRDGEGAVELRVEDDGTSISTAQASSGGSLGLLGMHERAALHGGEVRVAPRDRGGTSVVARIPTIIERVSR